MESSWDQYFSCIVGADGRVRYEDLDAWAWRVTGGERMRTPDEEEAIARVKAGLASKPFEPRSTSGKHPCQYHTLSKGEPRCAAQGRVKMGTIRVCQRHANRLQKGAAA